RAARRAAQTAQRPLAWVAGGPRRCTRCTEANTISERLVGITIATVSARKNLTSRARCHTVSTVPQPGGLPFPRRSPAPTVRFAHLGHSGLPTLCRQCPPQSQ